MTPSCNAGDTSSIPGWGTKIPHATRATTREKPAHTPQLKRRARTPQLNPDAAKK